jgi:hypothetical protein
LHRTAYVIAPFLRPSGVPSARIFRGCARDASQQCLAAAQDSSKLSCDEMFLRFKPFNFHPLPIMRFEFIGQMRDLVKIPICTKCQ